MAVERELDRVLTLLRNKIRERGFTQLEVQMALGWGRSYISQLLTKQKSLRVEQVLLILKVIGVKPSEFFGELYHFPGQSAHSHEEDYGAAEPGQASANPSAIAELSAGEDGALSGDVFKSFRELRSLLQGLVRLLIDKNMIDAEELAAAAKTSENSPLLVDPKSA